MTIRTILITFLLTLTAVTTHSQDTNWGVDFSDAIMDRHPNTINSLTGKGWEYSNSIILYGMIKIHEYTNNPAYVEYVKKYVDDYVYSSGSINFKSSDNNLDHLHPGLLLLFLYEQTGLEKYKIAADKIRSEFDKQPRNPSGGYWHKQRYPNQMWADGIYMAEPFLMQYGAMFDDLEYASNEATKQTTLLADHAYDAGNNLLYHGWDETLAASWADANGRSPVVWSRGMGWYCMALVDMLDYLPEDHEHYNDLVGLVQGLAEGIKNTQDEESGLWYQVVDKSNLQSNWIETSGSAMFIYMLKKGMDKGYLDASYAGVVEKGWSGMQNKITLDSKRQPVINDFVLGMGIKDNYSTYVSQARVSTPTSRYPHGYCAILSLASVMEWPKEKIHRLSIDIEGKSGIVLKERNDSVFMPGEFVKVTARPSPESYFDGWTGDVESMDSIIYVKMDEAKSLTAQFSFKAANKHPNASDHLAVFPNPANDKLHVAFTKAETAYAIFSLDGQRIKTGKTDLNNMISVADIPHGIYVLNANHKQVRFIKN